MPATADGSAPRDDQDGPPPDPRRAARVAGWATLGLVVAGLAWRVARFASCPPLWGDEAFIAVNLLARDYAGMLRTLEYYQIVPLGFLWAELAVVRLLGGSEWAVRLIPFLAGLAALGLFARFATRLVDRRSALIAVGIFAASYYPVRHATEVKPYATDLLIALAATMLAWSLRDRPTSGRRWAGLTLVVALGVWFSYPLVFVAAGIGLFLLTRVVARYPHARAVVGFAAFGLIAGSSWLASYLAFGRPQAQAAPFYSRLETWRGAFPPLGRPWAIPGWLLDVHTGNMLAYPFGSHHGGSIATAALVAVGVARCWRTRRDLLVLLLAPLPLMLAASCLRLYPYGTSARTTLFLAPAFCLLAGVGAMTLVHRARSAARRARWVRLATLTLGAIPVVAAVANVAQPYKNWEDWLNRRAIAALADLARPGDRWLVTDGLDANLWSRHAILEHWVQQVAEVRYNVLARAPVPARWLPDAAGLVDASRAGRTWLIVHRTPCPDFDEARLVASRRKLERRLGPPTVYEFALTRGESITAYHYPGPGTPDPRPDPDVVADPAPGSMVGFSWAVDYDDEDEPRASP